MTADTMLRSRADPSIAIDPAEVGRVVEELFPEALGVWVYGSFADGYARRDSDVDIGILPDRPVEWWDRHCRATELASRLHREVDLVDLSEVSDLLRFEALTRGIRVKARDPDAADRFEMAAVGMYMDLRDETAEWLAEIRVRGTVF